MNFLYLFTSFNNFFQEEINPIECFLISSRNNFESKIYIKICFFNNFFYHDSGSILYIKNSIEKCLIEECLFSNCSSSNFGGSLFIEYSLLKMILNKNCIINSFINIGSYGQFLYSLINEEINISFLTFINCSLINQGGSITMIKGNSSYKFSNISKQKMYLFTIEFMAYENNILEISFLNLNSNYLSHSIVLFIGYGNILKNVKFLNLINNSQYSDSFAHILNRETKILFDSLIINGNSHSVFGYQNIGPISTLKNSFFLGVIGSIDYINLNNSFIFKDYYKFNNFVTNDCKNEFINQFTVQSKSKRNQFIFFCLIFL